MDTTSPSSPVPYATPSLDGPPPGQPAQNAKKRPYQTRRKERSCDNCKLRKTKCDAHDDQPCTACINAKLECHFSSTEHEGRKIGPQRRIRDLERTVEQLRAQLREVQSSLERNQRSNISRGSTPIIRSNQYHTYGKSSSTNSYPILGQLSEGVNSEPADYRVPGFAKRQSEREPLAWSPNAFGPGSAPHFISSYIEYIERLGFSPRGIGIHQGNIIQNAPAVPLLSDYIPPGNGFNMIPMDLRAFLPEPEIAFQILEIFRRSVQAYKAPFYWPHIIQKFNNAFQEPLMENNSKAIGNVFCPVMMILAVGSQLVAANEISDTKTGQDANKKDLPQERQGWKYFELGRKYLGLNNPVYMLDDAMVLVLMSLYLDKATLPSPCWMICGAMSRVCQDIGLHRVPPAGGYDPIQLECRARLFWLAYIQDKRVSMKMGRPFMLRAEDCDVPHPGTFEYSGIKRIPEDINEAGGCSQFKYPAGGARNVDYVSQHALETTHAIINGAKVFEEIQSMKLSDGDIEDIQRLQEIDYKLLQAWKQLPEEIRDYEKNEELDVPAARSLFVIQHSRLILFRHFTVFSRANPITDRFRTVCLEQSVQISKITARVLHRLQLDPKFMNTFGVRTDDLVHLHTFRAAVILLWGVQLRVDQDIERIEEDLRICLIALDSIARVHITGARYLSLYKQFAQLFHHHTASFSSQHTTTHYTRPKSFQPPNTVFPQPDSSWNDQPVPWEQPPPPPQHPQNPPTHYPFSTTNTTTTTTTEIPVSSSTNPVPPHHHHLPPSHHPHPHQQHGGAGMPPVSTPLPPGASPGPVLDPESVPNIMNQVRNGDWNSFQELLAWDPNFENSVAGPGGWYF